MRIEVSALSPAWRIGLRGAQNASGQLQAALSLILTLTFAGHSLWQKFPNGRFRFGFLLARNMRSI